MMTQRQLAVIGAIGAFAFGLASTTLFSAERFDHQVRNKFFAGFNGDSAALDEAMKICEAVLAENPKHAEARVWYGSGQMTQSARLMATDRAKGIEMYMTGLRNMDQAVAEEPKSVGVRVPRAAVMQAVSRFTPKEQTVELLRRVLEDYEFVLELQKPTWDKVGSHPKGELLFGLADAYSRTGDTEKANAFFDRISTEMPGTPYAKRAAMWKETKAPLPVAQTRCIGCHTPGK